MEEETQEQAVPFLIYDQNTKIFTLTEQGEDVIRSLNNSNFGVIAVAGMYRTGKSYLLNRMLLNRQKGFSVGPTVNPCTKGLWIWSKPIYGTGEDGKRLPLLLIDTEGFGAFDEDQNHDIRIFTLAILLCSYFVYNSLGSIDENAIQSLSFVINLSKHIQMKNTHNGNFNDTDPEDLANLFPSFLWILRDFSLQLVDENEEQITPKEYLEKVLDFNKQTSDHEQKNKIRKLIKSYFKDRDCFTMVRPMLKEKELQNLENSGPDKLRPEFLEQILSLRKKILTRVKVKTFKNQPLSPDISLIHAINSGRVPNIENTWISMCKVECYKAFEISELFYENTLRDNLNSNGATDQMSLKSFHQDAKEKSLELFRSKAIGDVAEEHLRLLKEKIKEKFSYFSNLYNEENKNNMIRVLQKWYSVIEYKIQGNELKNVEEIESEFKTLEFKLNENFPQFESKAELFNEFKSRVLNFASDFYMNKMNNEVNILKQENEQVIAKLNLDIKQMKTNFDNDLIKKNFHIEQIKQENQDLKNQINKIMENLAILEKEKDQQLKSSNDKTDRLKDDYERKINDLLGKISIQEEKSKEIERNSITVIAESEKDKALYEQKIEQLTKQISEFNKKDKETEMELKSQLKEQSIANKESTQKYDSQIKNMRSELENLKEKLIDLESQASEKDNKLESEKIKFDEMQNKFNSEKNELNEKVNTLKNKLEGEKNKLLEDLKNKENDFLTKEKMINIKLEELEIKNKFNEENLKNQLNKIEREAAVLKQNNEFLDIQVKELNTHMEDQKKAHENIISTLESKTFSMVGHQEFQKKVDEIKSYFENDKKQLEESFEKTKVNYIYQIDNLTEKLNESEFKSKFNLEECQKEMTEIRVRLEKSSKEVVALRNEKINISENMVKSNLNFQEKLRNLTEDYEKKFEDKENKHQKEMYELNRSSEETINQMKALFETEKIRFEEKLKEEKHKNERKSRNDKEDLEGKLKEVENELRDEIENLQNENENLESRHLDYVTNIENEMGNLNSKLENAENGLKETKEAYLNMQNQLNNQIEQMNENYNKERKDLISKIESLNLDNNKKEKENVSFMVKTDQLEKLAHEKEMNLLNLKKEYEEEKKDIMAKLEDYKKMYNESHDEYMKKKLEYIRENALQSQQIEFLNKKIEEYQNTNEINQKRYEEKLFGLRSEVEKDMNEKSERVKKEKEDLESKLFQKKKELRDLEQTFLKQNNSIEKEKTILSEKLSSMEEKKKEMQENFEKELENLNNNLKNSKKESSKEKEDLLNNLDDLKKKVSQLENDLNEKNGNLEKEQILWDGKFKFIEQQRDNYKKDLTESQKRFENLLESMQKKGSIEKEKLETAQQSAISTIEQKYLNQIKEIQDSHQKLYSEMIQDNKALERENKNLNLQAGIKDKGSDNSNLLAQIEEITNDRNRFKKELDDLKKQKENQMFENQGNFDKEKTILKSKIVDVESKVREIESKRGALMLEYEKDKAKWSIEKDNLGSKNSELQENLERLEKKNETLLRENEKLKADKLNSKRASSKGGMNLPGVASGNFNSMLNNGFGLNRDSYKIDGRTFTSFLNKDALNNNNPYGKEINKILDNSDKSFDKIEQPKLDVRYDKFETFGRTNNQNKSPLNFLKPLVTKTLEEENGNTNKYDNFLNKK